LSLVLKSGCQIAHETARGVTAARHENAVKLAAGLQVGANDLVSNLANRGGLDAQAPQCSFSFLFFSAAILWKILRFASIVATGPFCPLHLLAVCSKCFSAPVFVASVSDLQT